MSEIITKKEIINIINNLYRSINFYDNICFVIRTNYGTFSYFKTNVQFKNLFINNYNQFNILINKSNNIDYKIFETIKNFLYALSKLLTEKIVTVETKYVNNKYVYTIKNHHQTNPIQFIEKFPAINKNYQGKIITKNIIESLREHNNRFKNLNWTNIPNVKKILNEHSTH